MITLMEDEYERWKDAEKDKDMINAFGARKNEFEDRKREIFELIDNEPELVKQAAGFFEDKETLLSLKEANHLTADYLQSTGVLTSDVLQAYYKHAKFKYECGMYDDAQTMLGQFLLVQQGMTSSVQGAMWGKLACGMLQGLWMNSVSKNPASSVEDRANALLNAPKQWQSALNDFNALKDGLREVWKDPRQINPVDQLQQRAWLMHWGLFVFFNQKESVDVLVDLFSERAYLETMENLCPWLLRYYTVALILSPARRKSALKDILNEISSLSYLYSDPLTQFLDSLYDAFDFDIAQVKLQECQSLIKNDFFLQAHADKFVHEARMMICEMYCTVHGAIDLKMLGTKLQLSDEEAEKWMADMVRGAANGPTLDAKIDSFGKQVIISPPIKSAHRQVVDATKDLTARSAVLASNLESVVKEQAYYLLNRP